METVLSTIRHQLGNSVNALKITLDVLQENFERFDDEKRRTYLQRGSTLVSRQEELIKAMKAYSRYRVQEKKGLPFQGIWDNFLSVARKKVKQHHIMLAYSTHMDDCEVLGESMSLNKVMMNLMENAIEALKEAREPKIDILATPCEEGVLVSVKDNGIGIKERDLPRVFIPLFTTKEGKAGTGLPVARKLLVEMDGRIDIESLYKQGTDVRVWLKTVHPEAHFSG